MVNLFETKITEQSNINVQNVLKSGMLSNGSWVSEFEETVKYRLNFNNFLALNSGTSALHLAFRLCNLKPDDEVIMPAQTFVASGIAAKYFGAYVRFADINRYGLINPDEIEKIISPKTKAIVMVHWGGIPADIDKINEIARRFHIKVIEDAAQAFASKYGKTYVGNLSETDADNNYTHDTSDFVCFSFQATKQLTTGDGGGLVCKSDEDAQTARDLSWFGISRDSSMADRTGERNYNLAEVGYKYHMNNIAAALGLGQLDGVGFDAIQREIRSDYFDRLLNYKIQLSYKCLPNFWFYHYMARERNTLIQTLYKQGYQASAIHRGIDYNKIFGGYNPFLVNQRVYEEHFIALPLSTSFNIEKMSEIVLEHEKKYGRFEW